jgi:hypothetical protein
MSAQNRVSRGVQRRPDGRFSHRSAARHGEVRMPAGIAVVLAAALHAALPNALLTEPRYLIPGVEIVLLIPLVAINPTRLTTETRWSRMIGLILVFVIIATNLIALGYLLHALTSTHIVTGRQLLLAGAQVLATNIIAFALLYWELDRGGAVARLGSSGQSQRRADFLFPQDDQEVAKMALGTSEDARWIPTFVDYLYLSVTNSTAFSPTDTLPLSSRAKLLMSVQALAAIVTSLLVVARAVNILR